MYCAINDFAPEYETVKRALLERVSKAEYFTERFYKDYLAYREKAGNNIDGEVITKFHDDVIKKN